MLEIVNEHKLIFLLIILIIVDVLTGIVNALKKHSLKSAVMQDGGYKKFLSLLICLLSYSLDLIYFNSAVLYPLSCSFYVLYESISIIENLGNLGVPIPAKIKSVLYNLKAEVSEEAEENKEESEG